MDHPLTSIVGIDEAGRGPLAGPVAVGAVRVPIQEDLSDRFSELTDSKELTEKQRDELYAALTTINIRTVSTLIPPMTIDRYGMTEALSRGVSACLAKINADPDTTLVRLDATLRAPHKYPHQESRVSGDLSESAIAAASVIAKVERDRRMIRYAERWPQYGFEKHKGYGTKEHREAIRRHGPCELHRARFIKNI